MEPTMITDPMNIRSYLLSKVIPLPDDWKQYADLATSLGCRLHAVPNVDDNEIEIGSSPGGTWAFQNDLFVSKREDPDCTVLHEVCHWVVALKHGLQESVNFGNTLRVDRLDDELATCDAQITWLLVYHSPKTAWKAALHLQYDTTEETIRSTIESGCQQWASCGRPLEVSEELLQELAHEVNPTKTPDDSWNDWDDDWEDD